MITHCFPYCLVVLRHGQSEWNAAEVFTGWANPHPTAQGELEATRAGALLAEHGVLPAFAHTSLQTCARMPGAVRISTRRPSRRHRVQQSTGTGLEPKEVRYEQARR